VSWYLHT